MKLQPCNFLNRFLLVIVLSILIPTYPVVCADNESKIDQQIRDNLRTEKPHPVIIECQGSDTFDDFSGLRESLSKIHDTDQDLKHPIDLILESAAKFLAPIIKVLDRHNAQYEILPITNSVIIYSPITSDLLEIIATITIVVSIHPDRIFKPKHKSPIAPPTGNSSWSHGLIDDRCESININRLGTGVTVGIIDDGVMYNHTELEHNWLGKLHKDYGWFDATVNETESRYPDDPQGDGTRFLGVAVGKTVGVAPNATWIACRSCSEGTCSRAALELCVIYMTCPWKWNDSTRKATRNCSLGAKVVLYGQGINSLGGQLLYPFLYAYYKLVQFWNDAKIIPVFAMGDYGPNCNSASYPGSFDISLSVGAVDENSTVTDLSSRGPVLLGRQPTADSTALSTCPALSDKEKCTDASNNASICTIVKPDIVAPGNAVNTSSIANVTSYETASGTGVAAAHVAGVVALMISANPGANWNHKTAYEILTKTTDITRIDQQGSRPNSAQEFPAGSHLVCNLVLSGICDGFPDNLYGWGVLHACNAVKAAMKLKP